MRGLLRVLYLLVPAGLVAAALIVTFYGFQEAAETAAAPSVEPPRYAATGVQWLRLGRQGEPEFRADAETLDYYADESVVMKKVRLDALGGYSSPWHLEAPRANAPPRERRIRLSGGVRATGDLAQEHVSLDTPRLWVDLLRRELYTDADVKMVTDFRTATARGLRSDFAGGRVQLLNDVKMDYVP
ncbi:MAG: LPS export ABC transporter periplasmic protein LptC, partial [Gammaproteobacteria bacterium]